MSDGPTPFDSSTPLRTHFQHELATIRDQWWWFVILGACLIAVGSLAMGMSFITSVVTVVFFGAVLLVCGIAQMIGSFWVGRWSGFLVSLLIGLLYTVSGLFIFNHPVGATIELTLLLAAMLIVSGLFRIVAALVLRFHHWGWPLLNGVVTLMLGLLIYKQWPMSGLNVIGLFVGIEMIFNGWTWLMLGVSLRSLPRAPAA